MLMTEPERSQRARKVLEQLDRFEDYRVEVIRGTIVMSPTPRVKHAGMVRKMFRQFDQQVSKDLVAEQVVSVNSAKLGEDHTVPDLVVLPADWEDSDEWLVPAEEVELVAEVVSVSNATSDTVDKPKWYAEAGIPLYLLVDPRKGTWRLHSEPTEGVYSVIRDGGFGQEIPLPKPFDFTLRTDDFKVYES